MAFFFFLTRFMWWHYQSKRIVYDPSLYQYEPPIELFNHTGNRTGQGYWLEASFHFFKGKFSYDSTVILEKFFSGKMAFVKTPHYSNQWGIDSEALDICESVVNKSMVRSVKLKIEGGIYSWTNKIRVKDCNGRYYVHSFHPCVSRQSSLLEAGLYDCSIWEQDGRVVMTPAFGSKGPRFDPRQQPIALCSCHTGGPKQLYTNS